MLTSQQVVDAIKAIDGPGMGGRVEALRRTARGDVLAPIGRQAPAAGESAQPSRAVAAGPTKAQSQLLDDLVAAAADRPRPEQYPHPGDEAVSQRKVVPIAGGGHQAEKTSLSPADVAWIQRLPSDPAQIPYRDAVELLSLQQTVTDKSDRRLLDAVGGPVKAFHDRMAAEVAVRNAQAPRPLIPDSAVAALADAVAAEHPDLRPHEAAARASDAVDEIAAARAQARASQLAGVRYTLDALDADDEARRSPTKLPGGALA